MSIDTLFNNIHHLFNSNIWICSKTSNKLCYNNASVPLDEYAIEVNNINNIIVSIPMDTITFKTSFNNITENNNVFNYIKMHIELYNAQRYSN